jgi:hypothetical protein
MWSIHATSVPYISKLHISKLTTIVKNCNSFMTYLGTFIRRLNFGLSEYDLTVYIDRNIKNNEKQVAKKRLIKK